MADRAAEAILKALFAALDTAAPAGVDVWRNEPLPVDMPASGLLILTDGDPGEPEVTMSPLRYHFEHRARIEVLVEGRTAAERDARFNAALRIIGQAVTADRTLGGLCDWVEAMAPEPAELVVDGAMPMKAATVDVMLHYATLDPIMSETVTFVPFIPAGSTGLTTADGQEFLVRAA